MTDVELAKEALYRLLGEKQAAAPPPLPRGAALVRDLPAFLDLPARGKTIAADPDVIAAAKGVATHRNLLSLGVLHGRMLGNLARQWRTRPKPPASPPPQNVLATIPTTTVDTRPTGTTTYTGSARGFGYSPIQAENNALYGGPKSPGFLQGQTVRPFANDPYVSDPDYLTTKTTVGKPQFSQR